MAGGGCRRGLPEGVAGGGDRRPEGVTRGVKKVVAERSCRRELSEGVAGGGCWTGLQKGLTGGGDRRG